MVDTYVIAFIVASIFGAAESVFHGRAMPVRSDTVSVVIWLAGVIIEGGFGCLAAYALTKLAPDLSSELAGLCGGLGAATILRQRFAEVNGTAVGIAYAYDRTREYVNKALAHRSATRYAAWKGRVKTELVEAGKVQELADQLDAYIRDIWKDDAVAALSALSRISRARAETETSDREKLDALLESAREFGANEVVRRLYCEATGEPVRRPIGWRAFIACVAVAVTVVTLVALAPFDREGKPREVKRGEPLRIQEVNYNVQTVETAARVGEQTRADEIYVILEVLVDNESPAPVRIDRANFSVKTPDDEIRPAKAPSKVLDHSLQRIRMKPEEREVAVLAFNVPRDDLGGLRLVVEGHDGSRDGAAEAEGLIDLGLTSDLPPVVHKAFRGRTEGGLRVRFRSAPGRVEQIILRGRRECTLTIEAAALDDDRSFSQRHRTGVVVRGTFTSTIEVTGQILQPKKGGRRRCISRTAVDGWSARAQP